MMAPVLTMLMVTMGGVLVTSVSGDRINIVSVSEDLLVKQGHSANMTCTTDQVSCPEQVRSMFHCQSVILSRIGSFVCGSIPVE